MKKETRLVQHRDTNQSYWAKVRIRFRKNSLARWSLYILYFLIGIAFFSDFLANDKPLYCKIEEKIQFPILKQYAVDLGLSYWTDNTPWTEKEYQSVVWPLIPYAARNSNIKNSFVSPLGPQDIASPRYRHWLGTDELGRDVAAGMISGTRKALLIGIFSMAIASLIGIFFGAVAGYFGDNRLSISYSRLWLNLIGITLAIFYGFIARSYLLTDGAKPFLNLFISFVIAAGILLVFNILANWLERWSLFGKRILLPLDLMVMRLIETKNSIPTLLFILAILAIIPKPSIWYLVFIIGFLRWTGIARFVRAELLRTRNLEYIEAAQTLGYSEWRIIRKHALPNSLGPVLIAISFGIAASILIEASLSFLGIGVPVGEVTWGSMLKEARANFSAWWLAIFPGLAIFLTVTIFNLIGEGLSDAMDMKHHQKDE